MTSNDTAPGDDGTTGRRDDAATDDEIRDVEVVKGDAVVPDAADAPSREDMKPEDPPAGALAEGSPDQKSAVAAPIPAHGEMASRELIEEAARAAEEDKAEA